MLKGAGLTLERITVGVLTCKLWNLWLIRPTKQPGRWRETARPHCSLLTFCYVTHRDQIAWKCSLADLQTELPHTSLLSNCKHLDVLPGLQVSSCIRQILETAFRFLLFPAAAAQWIFCLLGQLSVTHDKVQLCVPSWQPVAQPGEIAFLIDSLYCYAMASFGCLYRVPPSVVM